MHRKIRLNQINFESNNYDLTKLLTKLQCALLIFSMSCDNNEIRNLTDTAELLQALQLLKNVLKSRGFGRGQRGQTIGLI